MTPDTSHRSFIKIGTCVVGLWAFWALFGKCLIGLFAGDATNPYENVGQFGDSFGALNTLFAGIAALGATFAYLSQKEELQDTKRTLEKQQFESTFFQLLEVFNQTVNSIVIRSRRISRDSNNVETVYSEELRGREAIAHLEGEFRAKNAMAQGTQMNIYEVRPRNIEEPEYEIFSQSQSAYLSHYFRTLYRLLAFIYASKRPDGRVYGKIIRAQLSDPELYFLFYNGIVEHGVPMNKFVDAYALLKHLPVRPGYPSEKMRAWLGNEKSPTGEEISPAYCDEDDRIEILAKCSAQLSANP